MLQIQSPWREAERGLCWRHLSCSGCPSLLETPGLWQVCQEQWQIWSGADLSLHDKLCVLRTAKLEKCGQSSHPGAAGFIFILPDFVYDGMWLFYALDLAFWNKKQCILNLLEIIVKRPNFQQDFQLLKCWNLKECYYHYRLICVLLQWHEISGARKERLWLSSNMSVCQGDTGYTVSVSLFVNLRQPRFPWEVWTSVEDLPRPGLLVTMPLKIVLMIGIRESTPF